MNPFILMVRMQISTATLENSMEVPKKTRDYHVIQQPNFWMYFQRK
jgi:hypothetical protein